MSREAACKDSNGRPAMVYITGRKTPFGAAMTLEVEAISHDGGDTEITTLTFDPFQIRNFVFELLEELLP